MLMIDKTALIIIDVQGKLSQLVWQKEALFKNLGTLIRGAQILELPIILTEHIPAKLGSTRPEIAKLLTDVQPISKNTFSCCGNEEFMKTLEKSGRSQFLATGIETHICVYQTVFDLVKLGFHTEAVVDAVSSRYQENKKIGLEKMKAAGAGTTTVETALFELLKIAEGKAFKEIIKLIK